jgi:hypothetical protein
VTAPVQYGTARGIGAGKLATYPWHGQFLSRDRACRALADMLAAPDPGSGRGDGQEDRRLRRPALDEIVKALLSADVAHFDTATAA